MKNFALVVDDKIVVGPRTWHYNFFYDYIIDNALDDSMLGKLEPEGVIEAERWKILPVEELEHPSSFDQRFEQLAGPYLTINENNITGYYGKAPINLNVVKNNFKAVVASNRYNLENKGIEVELADSTKVGVYTDRNNRNIYLQKLQLMTETDTVNFKFRNKKFKAITKSDLELIVKTGVIYIQDLFDWEFEVSNQIDQCQDVETLKTIKLAHEFQKIYRRKPYDRTE